jgi:hypothetical protein
LLKKAIQGETDVKQLEFYVTVEYYENKKHASENININTPPGIYPLPENLNLNLHLLLPNPKLQALRLPKRERAKKNKTES